MIVSKLVFLSLIAACIVGCRTPTAQITWPMPPKPTVYPVKFEPRDNGLYLNEESSKNLLKNVNEMDAYTEKLEALIESMKSYYDFKEKK
jgi:hypothetical protein